MIASDRTSRLDLVVLPRVSPYARGVIVRTVHGVDFSGAAEAGRNMWIARCAVAGRRAPLRLASLDRLEDLAGESKRDVALPHLVELIRSSHNALWAIDCPFGLPVELGWTRWSDQLAAITGWSDTAQTFGRHCCDRSIAAVQKLHQRRTTDVETRTPFDCYHYRIIHQTFHGMRSVVMPLRDHPQTCILPFQPRRLAKARRVIVETCPGSTLRRLKLPHNRYKQTKPGRIATRHVRTRELIFAGLEPFIEIGPAERKAAMRNPGGDALDAIIAAVGAWFAWHDADHRAIATHARYRHEGYIYC